MERNLHTHIFTFLVVILYQNMHFQVEHVRAKKMKIIIYL